MGRRTSGGARAEAQVIAALRSQLARDETLLTGVRITDPRDGDVEIDAIVLFPDLGAAVIEIKGGAVTLEEGRWTTGHGTFRRTIHPIAQARKGKHALRRYLDRQPDWQRPLLRSAWFVAMPQTEVVGDMGPEGHRDHLLGKGDMGTLASRMRDVLASSLNSDPMPSQGWGEDALALLLRSTASTPEPPRRRRVMGIAAAVMAVVVGGLMWWGFRDGEEAPPRQDYAPVSSECHPNYSPCIPMRDDLDCSEIRMAVTVTGADPYDLDRDGDGRACETYE